MTVSEGAESALGFAWMNIDANLSDDDYAQLVFDIDNTISETVGVDSLDYEKIIVIPQYNADGELQTMVVDGEEHYIVDTVILVDVNTSDAQAEDYPYVAPDANDTQA